MKLGLLARRVCACGAQRGVAVVLGRDSDDQAVEPERAQVLPAAVVAPARSATFAL